MAHVLSVNIGSARPSRHAQIRQTGIDKRPAAGPVELHAPGPKGVDGSGVSGDTVCDLRHHGGPDQAVYAYAREDLDRWQEALGRTLAPGMFGENLTTVGIDLTEARIGERLRVGRTVVLEVSCPRIPCRTFAGFMGERGWVRRFTQEGRPGAYLRVLAEGPVEAGDAIQVEHRPEHDVTIGLMFRALTTERALLPRLLAAGGALPPQTRAEILSATASSPRP